MGAEKYEFTFDEDGDEVIEVEGSSAEELDLTGDEKPEKPKKEEPKDEDDDVELEVVDDTPEEDRGRKPSDPPDDVTEDELNEYSEKVKKRIKHFNKGYHDERRAKERAMRERDELETYARKIAEENLRLRGDMGKSREVMLEQAKSTITAQLEAAKRAYRAAYEEGDPEAILEAQDALTDAKLKMEKVNSIKLPALQEESNAVQQQVQEPERQPVKSAPDTRAQQWAAKNTWFGTDDEMTSFALGYHSKLVKDGVDPTSDEYYDAINARMRQVFPDNFEEEPSQRGQSTKSQDTVVAPATRSTAPKKVTLTKTQVSIAKRLGVPLDLYAKQVAKEMRRNG